MKHRFLYIMALLLTLATGAWAQDPDPIDLTPSADGTVWTLSTMPEYDVELEVTYYTDAELDQMAADEVIAKITAIGTVTYTPESKALIDAARTAYDALTAAQQALVTNISTLTDAETTYAALEAAAEQAAADAAFTEGVELTATGTNEWMLDATPAFDIELEVEYETALALNEVDDNTDALDEWDGYEADVTLTRTLKAGGWNTLAVPFNVSSTMLSYLTSQYGMEVKELTNASLENEGKTLMLTFTDATEMVAGTPYLVKVTTDFDFSAQALPNVVISKELHPVTTTYANFVPVFSPTFLEGGDKSVLFVTGGDKLTYPAADGNINGFRAYFQLSQDVEVRAFRMSFGDDVATGISLTPNPSPKGEGSVYSVDGRKYDKKPTQKGVYIVSGKKTVLK